MSLCHPSQNLRIPFDEWTWYRLCLGGDGIIPFPFIEEMCNRGMVAGAVFFKIDSLPIISTRKDRYQYDHDMFHDRLGKDTA